MKKPMRFMHRNTIPFLLVFCWGLALSLLSPSLSFAAISWSSGDIDKDHPVRAAHLAEIKSYIDLKRQSCGLSPYSGWATNNFDTEVVAGKVVRANHVMTLRNALKDTKLDPRVSGTLLPSINQTTAAGEVIKASHLVDMRTSIANLACCGNDTCESGENDSNCTSDCTCPNLSPNPGDVSLCPNNLPPTPSDTPANSKLVASCASTSQPYCNFTCKSPLQNVGGVCKLDQTCSGSCPAPYCSGNNLISFTCNPNTGACDQTTTTCADICLNGACTTCTPNPIEDLGCGVSCGTQTCSSTSRCHRTIFPGNCQSTVYSCDADASCGAVSSCLPQITLPAIPAECGAAAGFSDERISGRGATTSFKNTLTKLCQDAGYSAAGPFTTTGSTSLGLCIWVPERTDTRTGVTTPAHWANASRNLDQLATLTCYQGTGCACSGSLPTGSKACTGYPPANTSTTYTVVSACDGVTACQATCDQNLGYMFDSDTNSCIIPACNQTLTIPPIPSVCTDGGATSYNTSKTTLDALCQDQGYDMSFTYTATVYARPAPKCHIENGTTSVVLSGSEYLTSLNCVNKTKACSGADCPATTYTAYFPTAQNITANLIESAHGTVEDFYSSCVGGYAGTGGSLIATCNNGSWDYLESESCSQCNLNGICEPGESNATCLDCPPLICLGSVPSNATLCAGDSTNLTTPTINSLVTACTAPKKCEYTCNAGTPNLCNSTCVNTANDANNCGACGNACPSGSICQASSCVPLTCNSAIDVVKVYTNTIPDATGKYITSYDDFRGDGGSTVLQAMTKLCQLSNATLTGISSSTNNYNCISGQPTTSRHNGVWQAGTNGSGWCSANGEAIEWVYCQRMNVGTSIQVETNALTPSGKYISSYDDFRSDGGMTLLSAINSICQLKDPTMIAYDTNYTCSTGGSVGITSRHNGAWQNPGNPGTSWCPVAAGGPAIKTVNCQYTQLCCNQNNVCENGAGETNTTCPWDCPTVCTGTVPANATLCSGDNTNLATSVANSVVAACTPGTKCEYTCNSGYTLSGGICVSTATYSCTGSAPANATLCPTADENQSLSANVANHVVDSCSADNSVNSNKCEHTCMTGFSNNAGTCEALCGGAAYLSCTGTTGNIAGTYNGVFYPETGITLGSEGSFLISVAANNTYTGWLQQGFSRYAFSGTFVNGSATATINRWNGGPITVNLCINSSGIVAGRVSGININTNSAFCSTLRGSKQTTNPSKYTGTYTIVLPGQVGSATLPEGDSIFSVNVASTGLATISGTLADGTALSNQMYIGVDSLYPVYISLYVGKGALIGTLDFSTVEGSNSSNLDGPSGTLTWNKQAGAGTIYPSGFNHSSTIISSKFTAPTAGVRILNLPTGSAQFNGGKLTANFNNTLSISTANAVTNLSANALTMTFSSMYFTGYVTEPISGGLSRAYSGVVLQKQNIGYGFMLTNGGESPQKSSQVILTTAFTCTGTTPTNATLCSGDDVSLSSSTANSIAAACTSGTKCEYTCLPGYYKDSPSSCAATNCTNLVQNGSFESPAAGVSSTLTNWTKSNAGGNFEINSGGGALGTQFITLDSIWNAGTVSQVVPTTAGTQYILRLAHGAGGFPENKVGVFWNGTKLAQVNDVGPAYGGYAPIKWTYYEYPVTATSSTSTIAVRGENSVYGMSGFIDDVSLREVSCCSSGAYDDATSSCGTTTMWVTPYQGGYYTYCHKMAEVGNTCTVMTNPGCYDASMCTIFVANTAAEAIAHTECYYPINQPGVYMKLYDNAGDGVPPPATSTRCFKPN